jgi:hypothetical protein
MIESEDEDDEDASEATALLTQHHQPTTTSTTTVVAAATATTTTAASSTRTPSPGQQTAQRNCSNSETCRCVCGKSDIVPSQADLAAARIQCCQCHQPLLRAACCNVESPSSPSTTKQVFCSSCTSEVMQSEMDVPNQQHHQREEQQECQQEASRLAAAQVAEAVQAADEVVMHVVSNMPEVEHHHHHHHHHENENENENESNKVEVQIDDSMVIAEPAPQPQSEPQPLSSSLHPAAPSSPSAIPTPPPSSSSPQHNETFSYVHLKSLRQELQADQRRIRALISDGQPLTDIERCKREFLEQRCITFGKCDTRDRRGIIKALAALLEQTPVQIAERLEALASEIENAERNYQLSVPPPPPPPPPTAVTTTTTEALNTDSTPTPTTPTTIRVASEIYSQGWERPQVCVQPPSSVAAARCKSNLWLWYVIYSELLQPRCAMIARACCATTTTPPRLLRCVKQLRPSVSHRSGPCLPRVPLRPEH